VAASFGRPHSNHPSHMGVSLGVVPVEGGEVHGGPICFLLVADIVVVAEELGDPLGVEGEVWIRGGIVGSPSLDVVAVPIV